MKRPHRKQTSNGQSLRKHVNKMTEKFVPAKLFKPKDGHPWVTREIKRFNIRPEKNRCVSANMPKKIRVGRSENLFIFLEIFI